MFKYTVEGCAEAVKYLKATNQYDLLEKELSLDGWVTVSLANNLISKNKDSLEVENSIAVRSR